MLQPIGLVHMVNLINRLAFKTSIFFIPSNRAFRNIYYSRLGLAGKILPLFLKPIQSLFINPYLFKNYEGGLYIAHGKSVQIYANKIGKNLWMHHNVTIGIIWGGRPVTGDNVHIGTGAVILGGITIDNNVRIGANATVIDDVPDNTVVVSPKAKVIKILQDPNIPHGCKSAMHKSDNGPHAQGGQRTNYQQLAA